MGAASARPNLVDLLLPMSGVLTREGLTVWTKQLSDADVLKRVERLKVSLTYEPSLMVGKVKVLEELSEEAIQFMNGSAPMSD